MTFPIRFLPEARDEFDAAADWYEHRQAGLGAAFVLRVQDVLDRIAQTPSLYAVVYRDVRQAALRQFPYTVLYRQEAAEVLVISVFHSSRDPANWQARVGP